MEFLWYKLGNIGAGRTAVVSLSGTEANVKLLDEANFQKYRAGQPHQYYGGHYTQSPARIQVPHSGSWYVAVDLGGYGGSVQSSVTVI